jgi:hypothetical protein
MTNTIQQLAIGEVGIAVHHILGAVKMTEMQTAPSTDTNHIRGFLHCLLVKFGTFPEPEDIKAVCHRAPPGPDSV